MKTDREIAEKMITDAAEMAKEGWDILHELVKPKPKLRHGDYGIAKKKGDLCGFVFNEFVDNSFFLSTFDKKHYLGIYDEVDEIVSIDGNFDDLNRNAEDLEDFEVHADGGGNRDGFRAKLISDENIRLGNFGQTWVFDRSQVVDIHQQLGVLLATQARKQK